MILKCNPEIRSPSMWQFKHNNNFDSYQAIGIPSNAYVRNSIQRHTYLCNSNALKALFQSTAGTVISSLASSTLTRSQL
jgi:hypothetical protein